MFVIAMLAILYLAIVNDCLGDVFKVLGGLVFFSLIAAAAFAVL